VRIVPARRVGKSVTIVVNGYKITILVTLTVMGICIVVIVFTRITVIAVIAGMWFITMMPFLLTMILTVKIALLGIGRILILVTVVWVSPKITIK